jgi:hypothetical protein
MRRFALCWVAALLLPTGCKKDVSGSYLASDQQTVCWLPLVRTPDDHVTGQMVCSVMKPDGSIDHESVSLTGAVNGENITLSGGGFFGLATTTESGTFDGNILTLTGVQSSPAIFKRARLADYQALIEEQSKRSQAIVSERAAAESRQKAAQEAAEAQEQAFQAEQNFEGGIDQLIGRMQRFDSEADVHLGRFPNFAKSYEAITAKVNEFVTHERQLAGNPNASNVRAQLVNAATQASFATDQMHFQAQSLESSLETNITPLVDQVGVLEQSCNRYGPAHENPEPTSAEAEAHKDACNRLLNAAPLFHQKYVATESGLSHLEAVYRHEKDAQAQLLTTADRME